MLDLHGYLKEKEYWPSIDTCKCSRITENLQGSLLSTSAPVKLTAAENRKQRPCHKVKVYWATRKRGMELVLCSMDALHIHSYSACIKEVCHVFCFCFFFFISFPNNGQSQLISRKEKVVVVGGFFLEKLDERINEGAKVEPHGKKYWGFSTASAGSWQCLPFWQQTCLAGVTLSGLLALG